MQNFQKLSRIEMRNVLGGKNIIPPGCEAFPGFTMQTCCFDEVGQEPIGLVPIGSGGSCFCGCFAPSGDCAAVTVCDA